MQDWNDHKRLATRLAQTSCQWILSSYDVPEIRVLYAGYNIVPVQSYSGMRKKKDEFERVLNEEVLVLNFEPGTQNRLAPATSQFDLQPTLL